MTNKTSHWRAGFIWLNWYLSFFLDGLFTNYSCFQTENSNDGEKTQWKGFPYKRKGFPFTRRTYPRTWKTFPYRIFLMRRKLFSHHWHVWVGGASISGGIPIILFIIHAEIAEIRRNKISFYCCPLKSRRHERTQAGGEVRSTEPLLSTYPLTEPRKGDRFSVVLQRKEMPSDIRFMLCRKGRNAVGIRQW